MPTYDEQQRFSPSWWFRELSNRQARRLIDQKYTGRSRDKPGLLTLKGWLDNAPPLPPGAPTWLPAYQHFHRTTRTNRAEVIVTSVSERLSPTGFRTAAGDDDNGDAVARSVWTANEMDVVQVDVMDNMIGMREGYVMVGPPPDGEAIPVITSEDPLQVITAPDPLRPYIQRAGLKTYYDPDFDEDIAVVYIRGENAGQEAQAYTARRPAGTSGSWRHRFRYDPRTWVWDEEPVGCRSRSVPIVRFANRKEQSDFETHIEVLDRLNRMTLQRMVIADLQTFRQRAVKGLPTHWPNTPDVAPELRGKKIDYEGVFEPGAGSMWMLPPGAEFWESQVVDIRPLLDMERMEERTLAALVKMPISYFSPDDANGTAEGASLQREGLVFRAEDRKTIATTRWAQVMSLAFEIMGDQTRADVSQIETLWAPIERLSLTERYQAASQAVNVLPRRSIWREVLQMSPTQIAQIETDLATGQLLAELAGTDSAQQALGTAALPALPALEQ